LHYQIIDSESFKLQKYFLEDVLANYKEILNDISGVSGNSGNAGSVFNQNKINFTEPGNKIIFEKIMKIMSKENFGLKNQSESLNSNIKVVKTNVRNII
jgi:hypothetical protein